MERQLTTAPHGHVLTNTGVWSPDSQWIVYDVRSDQAGSCFDGQRIERVHVGTGQVEWLYKSNRGACCGVVTYHPRLQQIVFIHGPEDPDPQWEYCAWHRRGVWLDLAGPRIAQNLDARDLVEPYTAGALRGGTHLHTFSGMEDWVAFTYEDHLLATLEPRNSNTDLNQRNVGVCVPGRPVNVPRSHPRNHDGSHFSVLVTQTVNQPRPGSDEISRAFSDAWIGQRGYLRSDGRHQTKAIAFLAECVSRRGDPIQELFIVDIPAEVTQPGPAPLQGTSQHRPAPPEGTQQRRLTNTSERPFPGIQGPRHWPRSSPEGERIAFLMRDSDGVVQLWSTSPCSAEPSQITHHASDIQSAFSWSNNGRQLAYVQNNRVCITDVATGQSSALTDRAADDDRPNAEACVFSPDGRWVAYVKPVDTGGRRWNQIFVTSTPPACFC